MHTTLVKSLAFLSCVVLALNLPSTSGYSSCSLVGRKSVPLAKHASRLYASDYSDVPRSRLKFPFKRRLKSLFSSVGTSKLENSSGVEVTTKEEDATDTSGLPTYRQLIVFTATTILIWISEPLLSLVDTTIVGMTSSSKSAVVQIASLGPATTLYDSLIYMTYFLAIAATNQIAPALAKKDWKRLRTSASHLMGLALLFGTLVLAITFGFGHQIIANMVGASTDAKIIPLATAYAWIRAAVGPFCVVDFVAQSLCLATLDTKTPAIAVAVASLVNVLGDLALAPRWGIHGAAVATAMASLSSCAILVNRVRGMTREWKANQEAEEKAASLTTKVVDGSIEMLAVNGSMKSKVVASKTSNHIPFFSLPDKESLVELFRLAGPIFFVMMGKIACYSIMTVRATSFGILPLAAHNIMMRVFFFFACFGDSVSQAAQTFFPQVISKKRGELVKRLLYLSAGVGFCISQFSFLILRFLGPYLTKDADIIGLMAKYAPFVGFSVLLHPFIMFLEGTILAKRDLLFLVGMYLSTMTLHFSVVFSPVASTFTGLWKAFFGFQAIRVIHFAARVAFKSRQEKRLEGKAAAALP